MPRGPKPAPADVQRLRGNPGKRVLAAGQPIGDDDDDYQVEGSAPAFADPPSWLTEGGLGVWQRLAPSLSLQNLLKPLDELTFARYCQMFARWIEANEALNTQSLVVETRSAHVTMDRVNKYLHVQLMLEQRLLNLEDRFGLNPAERQRIIMQRSASGARPGELHFPAPTTDVGQDDAPSAQPGGPIALLQ